MDVEALDLSARLAGSTAVILVVLAMPISYWLARTTRPWAVVVEAIVALPLILPPTVLGFYLLVALGPRSPIGRLYESLAGRLLPFSFRGLLVASILYSLPFAVQPMMVAFRNVDVRLLEASWALGVGRFATFVRTVIPLSLPGIVTAIVLSFAHTLGEFGVVLMVGGNIPGETRTVSIAIYDAVQALNYRSAGKTALVLLAISFAVLVLTFLAQRTTWGSWARR